MSEFPIKTEWLNKLLWPVFFLYMLAVIMGIINHESWSDEAQSWLIARDSSFVNIFSILPSEGHPPLWYMILFPFAKAGAPYETIKWISALLVVSSVYVLLFRTNLHIILKLLIPFSYFFFYEYSIIGRNYALIVFFTTSIISIYPNRFENPLLFVLCITGLFNSHVLAFPFAAGIALLYITDAIQYKKSDPKIVTGIVMMCIGGAYLVPYLATSTMTGFFESKSVDHSKQIATAITNGLTISGNSSLAIALLLATTVLLAGRTKPFLLFIFGAAGLLYMLGFRYSYGTTRHFGILFIILFAAYAIADFYKDDAYNFIKSKKDWMQYGIWLIGFTVLLQVPSTFASYTKDLGEMFSGSKEAAEYINDNNYEKSIVVGYQATSVSSVLPYMSPDFKFYYAECERFGTYYVYDSCFIKEIWMYPVDYAVKVTHDHFADKLKQVLFVFNFPIQPQTQKYLDLIYTTSEPTIRWDETFYFYKFKENVK